MNDHIQDMSVKPKGKKLFCFGFGYVSSYLAPYLSQSDWEIFGTTTDEEKRDFLNEDGINARIFGENHPLGNAQESLEDVTHLLISIPPNSNGDIVLDIHAKDIENLKKLEWVGYLSATSVYGNCDGNWVDEESSTAPSSKRGSERVLAENQWLDAFKKHQIPVHLFRLTGIYGPGRSALDTVRMGTARRLEKKGHAFNRIHVLDIVQTIIASINNPNPSSIYNLADDNPVPSHEVIKYACELLNMKVPPLVPFDQADVAPMLRSFYKDNKRIKNDKIKGELSVNLKFPDYKSGLLDCYEVEKELEAEMQSGDFLFKI